MEKKYVRRDCFGSGMEPQTTPSREASYAVIGDGRWVSESYDVEDQELHHVFSQREPVFYTQSDAKRIYDKVSPICRNIKMIYCTVVKEK